MDFNYEIRRSSSRRKLTITIERDGSVVVHAPASVADEKIREVVEAKRLWIYEKLNNAHKYAPSHPPGKELVTANRRFI